MNKPDKPDELKIDGEIFSISIEEGFVFINGARMCLSPYEAQILGEWLIKASRWESLQDE